MVVLAQGALARYIAGEQHDCFIGVVGAAFFFLLKLDKIDDRLNAIQQQQQTAPAAPVSRHEAWKRQDKKRAARRTHGEHTVVLCLAH